LHRLGKEGLIPDLDAAAKPRRERGFVFFPTQIAGWEAAAVKIDVAATISACAAGNFAEQEVVRS
jgi:hypothetical protein